MTSRANMETLIRATYAARVRGSLDDVMDNFATDAKVQIHARGTGQNTMSEPFQGTEVRPWMKTMIEVFEFKDWEEISLLIDGTKAALHWRARVLHTGTGKSDIFDAYDFFETRDGKIIGFQQSFDTALLIAISS